jgi:hypothetical protein
VRFDHGQTGSRDQCRELCRYLGLVVDDQDFGLV